MNEANLAVLTNIIGAVESGGQVYGKRDYARYTPPYKNSPGEHTITLGWYQAYGHEAQHLIQEIYNTDTVTFWRLDNADVETMLRYNWESMKWKPSAKEKAVLIALIDSPIGHEVQDWIFREKMLSLIADCEKDYTSEIPAQMMYCEIRHLGGKGPCDRIFKRCGGKYDLDSIMVSLVADQKDTSSNNQVGDSIYWSRHLKCRQFIDEYALPEEREEKYMGVIIGSARGDEYGNATGGKAGDQKQKGTPDYAGEVSMQNWYLHSKNWYVARAKDAAAREKIALDMEYSCNNANIGYDQGENRTLYKVAEPLGFDCSKVTTKCETDCAQLVRVCVRFAGIDCGDFYTATEIEALRKTGQFTIYSADKYCKSSDLLRRGDIICTRTKGHTCVVLSDGAKVKNPEEQTGNVSVYQTFLNTYYPEQVKKAVGALLKIDNEYGTKTRKASIAVWKYMANKYYGASLTVGNSNFLFACISTAQKMTTKETAAHPTLAKILQGVLAGRGYYGGVIDGIIGEVTKEAVKKLQKANDIEGTGELNGATWSALFN